MAAFHAYLSKLNSFDFHFRLFLKFSLSNPINQHLQLLQDMKLLTYKRCCIGREFFLVTVSCVCVDSNAAEVKKVHY